MLTFEWSDWRAGVFWWLQSVYVAPEARRRGVFQALFAHIRNVARADRQVVGLRLYVEEHNAPAIGTYRRLGMIRSGHVVFEIDWSKGGTGVEGSA